MSSGVILYNFGTGCMARMVVALNSLRKHYSGPVTVLSDGEESNNLTDHILADERLNVDVITPDFNVKQGKNHHYLAKCRMHEVSPYDVSLFIDADVIVKGDLTPLIPLAEKHEFVVPQFCNWKSNGRQIARRIMAWSQILPRDMRPALAYGPAVNTGVMAFTKDSKFMADWFKTARRGRGLFIPDETSCQVILYRYPHKVVDWTYNASCKYSPCMQDDVKLVHFHGRKHLRDGLPYYGQMWLNEFKEVWDNNIAKIQEWSPAGDRQMIRYFKANPKHHPKSMKG